MVQSDAFYVAATITIIDTAISCNGSTSRQLTASHRRQRPTAGILDCRFLA